MNPWPSPSSHPSRTQASGPLLFPELSDSPARCLGPSPPPRDAAAGRRGPAAENLSRTLSTQQSL